MLHNPNFDEYDEELDSAFLARYNNPRSTIAIDDGGLFTEDEEDDLWVEETKDTPIEILVTREKRRLYQRKYRSGAIPSRNAKEFQRKAETRKKLAYYLTQDTKDKIHNTVQLLQISRRDFCVQALQEFLASGSDLPSISKTSMQKRIFLFDEIPTELWNQLDDFCKHGCNKRQVRLYQITEIALKTCLKKYERK